MKAQSNHIRVAEERDVKAIGQIYGYYVENTSASFEEIAPPFDEMLLRFRDGSPRFPWLVAEQDGLVIGFCYAGAHRARSCYRWAVDTTVYLDEACRGQGMGKRLYAELLPVLKQQGFYHAFAGIAIPNPASLALHQSMGFQPLVTYENVGFKFGRWHSVSWLHLRLRDVSEPLTEPLDFSRFKID